MAATTAAARPSSLDWARIARFAVLPAGLAAAIVWGSATGPDHIPLFDVAGIIVSKLGLTTGHTWPASETAIVWDIRLPEVITAALVGAALSLSGAVFQAVLRNPLADPFVIGTSSGAIFAVALAFWIWATPEASIATFVWLGFGTPQLFAFAGALGAVGLVFLLTQLGRRSSPVTLLLAGFAVSTLMIAGMWFAAYQGGHINLILGWMMGTLSGSSWSQLTIVAPVIGLVAGSLLFFVRDLNALLLGEEQAGYLGLNATRSRSALIVMATVLTALSVSLAGIIGFVGLVIPHIGRLIYGANHQALLLASAFLGAIFLIVCDLLARTVESGGGELPLGVLTALVGVPVFLFLLLRADDSYSF